MARTQDPLLELTLVARITALYERAGYTVASFAAALKLSVDVVCAWQRFGAVPTLIELGELANVLHVSKRALCLGARPFDGTERGERPLTDAEIGDLQCALDLDAPIRSAFERHRRRIHSDHTFTRTYVTVHAAVWQAASRAGVEAEVADEQAMVIATQTDALTRAVVQGVRPVRRHQFTKLPPGLDDAGKAEYIASEIHRLAGIKPPIDPMVLAVACGQRLVPTFGASPGQNPSAVCAHGQSAEDWEEPTAVIDGDDIVLNGLLRVKACQTRDSGPRLLNAILESVRSTAARTPDDSAKKPGFGLAFLLGVDGGDGQHLMVVTMTDAANLTDRNWIPGALRGLAKRFHAREIYVVHDDWLDVDDCGALSQRRRAVLVDVESRNEAPRQRTFAALLQRDDAGAGLDAWFERTSGGPFVGLLPA